MHIGLDVWDSKYHPTKHGLGDGLHRPEQPKVDDVLFGFHLVVPRGGRGDHK